MPVYRLTDELVFPPPEGASPEGVVAVGGDYRPERLLLGYAQGIFPWPSDGMPLLWFSPDPRFVIDLAHVHVPRSLRKTIRRDAFEVSTDRAFTEVIDRCASAERPDQGGTWITDELRAGYTMLHRLGFAHSVEAWQDGELVGGLYGVALGRVFFGESMFADRPDASKVATVTLLGQLRRWGYELIDCQVHTEHLERFGAEEWPRSVFLRALYEAVSHESEPGPWTLDVTPTQAVQALLDAPG